MKTKILFLTYLFFALIFSACSPAVSVNHTNQNSRPVYEAAAATAAPAAPAAPLPQAPGESMTAKVGGQPQASIDSINPIKRIVIKNASLTIIVKDPPASMEVIGKMADIMGGYIVSTNNAKQHISDQLDLPQASISIRVPAERLNEALDTIKTQVHDPATQVENEQITGSDVTKDYTDLQSRLTNLNNAAAQLKVIMAQATKTEDVMSVYTQLMQVNEQIEVIKGQIKYYDEASSLSEINVILNSEASVKPISVAGWEPVGVARDAVQALITTLQVIASIGIWSALYILPIFLMLALAALLILGIIRIVFKKNKRTQNPQGPSGL